MRNILVDRTLWIFLLCAAIVILTQFLILQPVIKYSLFTADDWMWLLKFRSLTDLNFFGKLFFMWTKISIHEGSYAAYIGILGTIFGNNYSAYQYVTVALKIIATLTVFPVILILFKNRLLAFLTTIIYGISSASIGSFYWYMKGGIFAGITLMNLFFISYYFTILRNSRILLLVSSMLIFLSYVTSPTRIFPIFLVVIITEVYCYLRHKSKIDINSSVRVISLLLLPILISLSVPVSPGARLESIPITILKNVLAGNWFNLLSPLVGMGYSLLTVENMRIFGTFDLSTFANLNDYLVFLFDRSVWIFLFSLIFLACLISKKPVKFIIAAISLNFILDILMFYAAGHHFFIPAQQMQEISPSLFLATKAPTLVAIFILVTAFMSFLEWQKEKSNYLLMAVFIGPVFSLIFLVSMWPITGYYLEGYNSLHYYYQIPAIGISLFFAAILSLFYEKFKKSALKFLVLLTVTGIIFSFYSSSSVAINREFLGIYSGRVEIKDQQILHDKLMKKIGIFDKGSNILVYFELPGDPGLSKYYKQALFLGSDEMFGNFFYWHSKHGPKCIGHISNRSILESSLSLNNGQWGFVADGRCTYGSDKNIFYRMDNFYAYKIDKGEFVDIKDSVLRELNNE